MRKQEPAYSKAGTRFYDRGVSSRVNDNDLRLIIWK